MVTTKVGAPRRVVNPRPSPLPSLFPLDTGQSGVRSKERDTVKGSDHKRNRRRQSPLIRTIQRAALQADVDPAKFERLILVHEGMAIREARLGFDQAYVQMQANLPVICEHGVLTQNGKDVASYALWEDVNEAIKPVLSQFGFALRFRTNQEQGAVVVTAVLSHAAGHSEETTLRLPVDYSGGKNPVQAIGSSTSYGKRYTASALLNLTSRGDDNDGKVAVETESISSDAVASLRKLIAGANADEKRLATYLGVSSIEDLSPSLLEKAQSIIAAKEVRP